MSSNYSYQTYHTTNQMEIPFGSRSGAASYQGSPCPIQMNFGRVHGMSPARGSVTIDGDSNIPVGQKKTIQIGGSVFQGILIKADKAISMEEGTTTHFDLVDTRDSLHDINIFGQFNMMEDDGKWYHIYPSEWRKQKRRIIRKIKKEEFDTLDGSVTLEYSSDNVKLYSAFTLLTSLAKAYKFTWSGSKIAVKILKSSRPENLDWNRGKKVIEVISDIIDKNNLQFTTWGDVHVHITLRGFNDNAFLNRLLTDNLCTFPHFIGGEKGSELNEKGRRVVIIGGHNQYEATYPAVQNWNKKFTASLCLNNWILEGFLLAYGLTLRSKLKDLPTAWHDPEKWKEKPRNDMTIEEYIKEICFKVYVVDFEHPGAFSVEEPGEMLVTEEKWDWDKDKYDIDSTLTHTKYKFYDKDPFRVLFSSSFPVSKNLVTDSERQMHVYSLYKDLFKKGQTNPWDFDTEDWVPIGDGVSLETESVIWKSTGEEMYRIRLVFSEIQILNILPPEQADDQTKAGQTDSYGPMKIAAVISIDRELYKFIKGEQGNTPRIREQKHTIDKLKRSFTFQVPNANDEDAVDMLTFEEQPILSAYFRDSSDIDSLVKADEISERIASQLLNHELITSSGSLTFDQEVGFMCDGIIDSVNTSFSVDNGIQEIINLTSEVNDLQQPALFDINIHSRFKDVKQQVAELRDKKAVEAIMKDWKSKQQAVGNPDVNNHIGGQASWIDRSNVLGSDDSVKVEISASQLDQEDEFLEGELLVFKAP